MKKQLFFDDNKLFSKENVKRQYGRPSLIAKYRDENVSTDFCTGWVFSVDGGYRLLYFGHSNGFEGHKLFSAKSTDGINFAPEKLFETGEGTGKQFAHEIMDLGKAEIGFIYEDTHTDKSEERYKLLMSSVATDRIRVNDDIYVSADLIKWKKLEGAQWGDGAEPLTSVFYNKHVGAHTVISRDFWGIRSAGYRETQDFFNYSDYHFCLNVDSLDESLAEIYGMFAFEYDGNYIGVPHIYHGFGSGLHTKYASGLMDTELAYSTDGRYWHRSLRTPFVSGSDGTLDKEYKMVWVSGISRGADGIKLYAAATEREHGIAFHTPGTGVILVLGLREDGFISLSSDNPEKESVVATREKLWHGGELYVNLKARYATVAVYTTESQGEDMNILGIAKALEGFSHEDCVPFCGDSTSWTPEYKSGKRISELVGKTLVFELKFEDGEVYSFGGDFTDIFNVEGAIYRRHGVLRLK